MSITNERNSRVSSNNIIRSRIYNIYNIIVCCEGSCSGSAASTLIHSLQLTNTPIIDANNIPLKIIIILQIIIWLLILKLIFFIILLLLLKEILLTISSLTLILLFHFSIITLNNLLLIVLFMITLFIIVILSLLILLQFKTIIKQLKIQ